MHPIVQHRALEMNQVMVVAAQVATVVAAEQAVLAMRPAPVL